jgi:hypothetical protein
VPIRLTVVEREDLTVIRVDGRLVADGIPDLEEACRVARRPLVLDLTHLATTDDTGVVALRRLTGEGVHLLGASPYIGLLLGGEIDRPKPRPGPGRAAARRHRPGRV